MMHSFGQSRKASNVFYTELNRVAIFIAQLHPSGNFYNKMFYRLEVEVCQLIIDKKW